MAHQAIITLGVVMLVAFAVSAQGSPPLTPPAQPTAPAAITPPSKKIQGDIITLNSGKVLTGMQVLQKTPTHLIIEVLPSLEPLELLRKLVKSVKYDDIDPNKERRRIKNAMSIPGGNITPGEEISPQLHKKLTKPLAKQKFTEKDLRDILKKLAEEVQLPLAFDASIDQLSAKEREWTIAVKATSRVDGILRSLQTEFPNLNVIYQFDKVIIKTKEIQQAKPQRPNTPPNRP